MEQGQRGLELERFLAGLLQTQMEHLEYVKNTALDEQAIFCVVGGRA